MTTPSSTLSAMTYDGLDRRVIRQASGATRIYHYDLADHLIATSDASGGNWVEYIWLGDLPVAQLEGGAIYAIHTDQLNQPVRMTDASAAVVWDRTQRPFGETASETGSATNALRFPGQISDPETQTAYNMARDYDPSIGRYLQSDPIGIAGGLNTYSYAGNNPVVGKDPSGRFVQRIIIGGGIGAAVDIGIQLWNNGGQWECVNWWQVGQAALIGAGLQAAIELWAARAGIAAAWSRWIQAGGGAESETVIFNNGWRTLDGKFASPLGAGRAGGSAEVGVWDAIAAKPGWSVRTGNVAVRDASGQLRYYDGIAISPRDRIIGLEVKSGGASRTAAQRLFDTTLNSSPSNVATGVGQSAGTTVQRSILIRP